MSTTITITLTDDSPTAVEHAIGHTRAIEREFERVGCTALFEVHTGSLADESVEAERERILDIIRDEYRRRLEWERHNPEDRYWRGGAGALSQILANI